MTPVLSPDLRKIVDAAYPRFSAAEMTRRRAAIQGLLADVCADHLVYYAANRVDSAVQSSG